MKTLLGLRIRKNPEWFGEDKYDSSSVDDEVEVISLGAGEAVDDIVVI